MLPVDSRDLLADAGGSDNRRLIEDARIWRDAIEPSTSGLKVF